jgi:hypothetical protein
MWNDKYNQPIFYYALHEELTFWNNNHVKYFSVSL